MHTVAAHRGIMQASSNANMQSAACMCCMHVLKPDLQAGKAGSATARRASSSSEGGAGQLVASRAVSGRWGPASAPGSALDLGVLQAQVRSKNRVIADLRTQKQQLSGERRHIFIHHCFRKHSQTQHLGCPGCAPQAGQWQLSIGLWVRHDS